MGQPTGVEPAHTGTTIRGLNHLATAATTSGAQMAQHAGDYNTRPARLGLSCSDM